MNQAADNKLKSDLQRERRESLLEESLQEKFLEAFDLLSAEIVAFGFDVGDNRKAYTHACRNFAKWLGTKRGQDYLADVMLSPEVGLMPPLREPGKKKSANVEKESAKKSAKRSSAKKTLRYSAQKHGPASKKTSRKKSKPAKR
jgi:hypothetical protein